MAAHILSGTPAQDGYRMPGEFEPHEGCIMVWPERPGSWIYGAKDARRAFRDVIAAIAASETVYVAASKTSMDSAVKQLKELSNVVLFEAETDDAWARDIAPTFVVKNGENRARAINWEFNAWGGTVDGLYASWEKDNAFAANFAKKFQYEMYDAAPFVLEGGSIHSDGEGTVLVTETCLLSAGRNPALSKEEISARLREYLGAKKILWLPRGIYGDETNEHVDNVCAFLRPGEVVLAWTDNQDDPQYALSQSDFSYLEGETDAKGRKLIVHKLPIPDHPVCITKEELNGYAFEEGEDTREEGERLAASYVNFYFSNDAVILPAFGGENAVSDARAKGILQALCPDRKVIPIDARAILVGGGNIHCITQQIPSIR
jgi:agmatine deiminase